MANLNKQVDVAVGVIKKGNLFFVCRRKAHQHQGNKWEFPGGKVDANETITCALKRELQEEIGIEVTAFSHLLYINFDYPDKSVKLHVYLVSNFIGEAHGAEGQESQWLSFEELQSLDFPEANKAILKALT